MEPFNESRYRLMDYAQGLAIAGTLAMGQAASADQAKETPASMVGALHDAFGVHHARAVHAKGVILEGRFTATPEARSMSRAPLMTAHDIPVTVRFSDFTGIPDIPDTIGDANPRGFAVKFRLPDGSENDIVTHSFNGFPTRTSGEFAQLLRAIGTSGPNATKPTELDLFLQGHPIAKTFLTTQKPPPVSYATLSYFGVNAFTFTNSTGKSVAVRYRFVPRGGEAFLNADALRTKGPNYLSDEIAQRVGESVIEFDWYCQVASVGDVLDDPSIAWPESRRLVKLGAIRITNVVESRAADSSLLFLPGKLPDGVAAADPMIEMRNAAYPISFGARQ